MYSSRSQALRSFRKALKNSNVIAVTPLAALLVFWIGGESALIIAACLVPIANIILNASRSENKPSSLRDPLTDLVMRDELIEWANTRVGDAYRNDRQVAIISVTLDDLEGLEGRLGRKMRDTIIRDAAKRLLGLTRHRDVLARFGSGFAFGLHELNSNDTETLMQLANRLQSVFAEPFSDGPTRTFCTVSIGIAAETHLTEPSGAKLVAAAKRANDIASLSGPGSVRVYSSGLQSPKTTERDIAGELANALENGEISAWFQPQIQGEDATTFGFEALARWDHPEKGMVSPASFLPDIEKSGLSQRLVEVMLKQSLIAIRAWDTAGFDIKTVSVNFSSDELRNPRLPDFVRWELDRHDVGPDRLVIEVLESVASESNDDVIARTVSTLGQLGCRIDLDDFGTGNTNFINIRRFDVGRIKIDRSLVTSVNSDDGRAKMLAALLAFSKKLKIEALAEGVETEDEVHALRELGYHDMQGFAFARPMSLGDSLNWLEQNGPFKPPYQPAKVMASA